MSVDGWGAPHTKHVTWYDPIAVAEVSRRLPGREFLEKISNGELPPPPMASLFAAELVSVGDGEVVFHCTPDESSYNPNGMVHGGFMCTLLDTAAGCAVQTRLPAGVGTASIEIKVSFIKPARAGMGEVIFRGRALRVGRSVAFAEAHAFGAGEELLGHATSSLTLVRP